MLATFGKPSEKSHNICPTFGPTGLHLTITRLAIPGFLFYSPGEVRRRERDLQAREPLLRDSAGDLSAKRLGPAARLADLYTSMVEICLTVLKNWQIVRGHPLV